MWITINEPFVVSINGYGIAYDAPGKNGPGVNDYIAGHNLLKAHLNAYKLFKDKYSNSGGNPNLNMNNNRFHHKQ